MRESRLFKPFREAGLVCDGAAAVAYYLGTEPFLAASVGDAVNVYEIKTLRLCKRFPASAEFISAITLNGGIVLAIASDRLIRIWNDQVEVVTELELEHPVVAMISFGNLLVVGDSEGSIRSFEIFKDAPATELSSFSTKTCISSLIHPCTYINKVIVSFQDGTAQLWNLRTQSMLYEFTFGLDNGGQVTCMSQGNVVDIVAFGFSSGEVLIWNVKTDKCIIKFQVDSSVSAIQFFSESSLAVSTTLGNIEIFDLENRRHRSQITEAHSEPVPFLYALQGEAVFVSLSPDNSLKMWIFDCSDPWKGRLLKSREGHHASPSFICFAEKNQVLTSSRSGELRYVSLIRDQASTCFSRGSDRSQMYRISKFSFSLSRSREWDTVVTMHENSRVFKTWSYDRKAIGAKSLVLKHGELGTAVTVTQCGNFVLCGSHSGNVYKFNLQSGLLHAEFSNDTVSSAVLGICVDVMNKFMFSVHENGHVNVIIASGKFLRRHDIGRKVFKFASQSSSSLCAMACTDLSIRILDLNSGRIVRRLTGNRSSISSISFSSDGKWMLSSSSDGSIRVWDILSGLLIDCFRLSSPATCISMAPDGSFLATTHADSLAVHLWANKAYFSHVYLKGVSNDPLDLEANEDEEALNSENKDEDEEYLDDVDSIKKRFSLVKMVSSEDDHLISFSGLVSSKWESLVYLDTIKERNKPLAPVQSNPEAPFFLETTGGLNPTLKVEQSLEEDEKDATMNVLDVGDLSLQTLLMEVRSTQDYSRVTEFLKSQSPAVIDAEIKGLSLLVQDSKEDEDTDGFDRESIQTMLEYLISEISSGHNYEFVQSVLSVFLSTFASDLLEHSDFHERLQKLKEVQRGQWMKLEQSLHSNLCMSAFFIDQQSV